MSGFGLRIELFPIGSEAGLRVVPWIPLAFFLGGAQYLAPISLLLPEQRPWAPSEEDREEVLA